MSQSTSAYSPRGARNQALPNNLIQLPLPVVSASSRKLLHRILLQQQVMGASRPPYRARRHGGGAETSQSP
jgi:hypothetical protein